MRACVCVCAPVRVLIFSSFMTMPMLWLASGTPDGQQGGDVAVAYPYLFCRVHHHVPSAHLWVSPSEHRFSFLCESTKIYVV